VALVGKNGSGKSTLLKIIAGAEAPDSGKTIFRKGIKLGYLSQNPNFSSHLTIRDYIFNRDSELLTTIAAYEELIECEAPDEDKLHEVLHQMDMLSAWDFESEIKQILGKLGIHDLGLFTDELSGGQKKRVALAAALVGKPDFLILDEPTNHLDIQAIEWLENYLTTQTMSLLLVTHDRYFLECVTNEIIEIDNETAYTYNGNYSFYLEKKSERQAQEASEVSKAKNLLVKELDWLRRMPKARGTKAKFRIDAAHKLMDVAAKDLSEDSLTLRIQTRRQGNKVLEIHHLSKSYDGMKFVDDFSYAFKKKDRLGIVGKNGIGKTTFLNAITGRIPIDSGEVAVGETTEFGYYRQEEASWAPGTRVIDVVKEVAEMVKLSDGSVVTASQFLNHFMFPHAVQMTPVEKLSGGEKRRLQLMRVLIKAPNFLILDEPTNDLDIMTMNVLEDFLINFEGNIIVVSHDRYFMDKLTEHLFVFEDYGKITDFPGNYSDYRNSLEKKEKKPQKTVEPEKTKKEVSPITEPKRRLTFDEKKEFEKLEKTIASLESEKSQLLDKLNSGAGNHQDLITWAREIEDITTKINNLELRWLELSEFL
jgi:ABC transport system ATP-binding/permease protein